MCAMIFSGIAPITELNTAAGYGTSPYMLYSGWKEDGEFFYAMEILYGGIPGRPIGEAVTATFLGASPLHADANLQRYVNRVGRWLDRRRDQ